MVRVEFLRNVRTGDKLYLAGLATRIEEEHVSEMLAHGLIRLLEPMPPVELVAPKQEETFQPLAHVVESHEEKKTKKRGRRAEKEAQ